MRAPLVYQSRHALHSLGPRETLEACVHVMNEISQHHGRGPQRERQPLGRGTETASFIVLRPRPLPWTDLLFGKAGHVLARLPLKFFLCSRAPVVYVRRQRKS